MSEDDEEDLDSFMLGGYGSDVTSNGQRHHGRRRSRQERRPRSRERGSNLSASSSSNGPPNAASRAEGKDDNKSGRNKRATERSGQEQRDVDREMELTLSSSIDDDDTATPQRPSRLKPPPTSTTQSPHSGKAHQSDDDGYQVRDLVEARFGGRSKWFAGKVTRVYGGNIGEVYDIAYDDGDKEEGVFAARVRRPGQSPPSPRTGLAIDVKLARKGKGYHPAVIGRVNDDGTLYVKFDGGDDEWGVPVQQVIAHYSFEPAAERRRNSSDSSNLQHDTLGRGGGGKYDDKNLERDVDQHLTNGTAHTNDATTLKGPPSAPPTPREEENAPVVGTPRGPAGSSPSNTFHGPASRASKIPPSVTGDIDRNSQVAAGEKAASTPSNDRPHLTVTSSAPAADEQPGEEGGSLSWIADVAKSVGGSTLRSPGVPSDTPRALSIVDGVSPLPVSGFSPAPPLPVSGFSPAPAATPSPGVKPPANTAGKLIAPGTATYKQHISTTPAGTPSPNAVAATEPAEKFASGSVTPTHLEWKPDTDGSASRRWGAPPPDNADPLVTHKPSAPRLSVDTAPPTTVHHAFDSAGVNSADDTSKSVSGVPHDPESTPVRRDTLGSETDGGVAAEEKNQLQPAKLGAGIPGKTEECGGTGPNADDAVESSDRGTEAKPVSTAPNTLPRSSDTVAVVAGSGDGSALKDDVGGKDGRRLWDTLRASVQHRYAIEAMHLSEEVRLLKAKLNAADDNTRNKLMKQENKLAENVEGVLDREREHMNNLLSGERAASARRIAALHEELETAKRRLELERKRNSNHMAAGVRDRSLQRPTTVPSIFGNGYAASKTTKNGRAVRHTKARTTAISGKHGASSGAKPRLISTEHPSQPTPPIPPPRLSRREQQTAVIGTPSDKSMFGDPSTGTSLAAEGVTADGPDVERLMILFLDALESRDESIQKLTARLRCIERHHEGVGFHNQPLYGAGSGEREPTDAGIEGGNTGLEGTPPPLPARRLRTPDSVNRHGAIGWGASNRSQQSSLSFCKGHDEKDSAGAVATSQQQQGALTSGDHQDHDCDDLRWKLEVERRDMRRRLDSMKSEMERVIGQFRARAERAETKAAAAEERARMKAFRYFENNPERNRLR